MQAIEGSRETEPFFLGLHGDSERLLQLVRTIAAERLQFARLGEELQFGKDLLVYVLSSTPSLETQTLENIECALSEVDDVLETLDALKRDILDTDLAALSFEKDFMIRVAGNILTEKRAAMNEILNKRAAEVQNWTLQDWQYLQDIFKEKELPFSCHFIQRVQHVALESLCK